ncbi:MAG: hypothetical protein ACE5FV_00185 [Woeseia sp.]
MDNLLVIGILVLGSVTIGAILFFPMRWWMTRSAPKHEQAPPVTGQHLLMTLFVVVSLLGLFWFVAAGDRIATIVNAAIMLAANIGGFNVLRRSRKNARK